MKFISQDIKKGVIVTKKYLCTFINLARWPKPTHWKITAKNSSQKFFHQLIVLLTIFITHWIIKNIFLFPPPFNLVCWNLLHFPIWSVLFILKTGSSQKDMDKCFVCGEHLIERKLLSIKCVRLYNTCKKMNENWKWWIFESSEDCWFCFDNAK
jgi:hypothetical protein